MVMEGLLVNVIIGNNLLQQGCVDLKQGFISIQGAKFMIRILESQGLFKV